MQNISDIKRRIKSIQQTKQITKAMYLISTVKLRKALNRYEKNSKYIEKIRAVMKDILLHSGELQHPFLHPRAGERTAFIVIAGDKGLAGAYNHNVLNAAMKLIRETPENFVFTVGHVATQYFNRKGNLVDIEFLHTAQDPQLFNARAIAESLVDLYTKNLIDKVVVVYTHVVSTFTQQPRVLPLLPLDLGNFEDVEPEVKYRGEMIYEPSPDAVFHTLMEQYLIGLVYATLVQSYASEQSARMRAMDSATQNAEEMIEDLNQEFRRARQAAITNEIIELVSGTNAVRNAQGRA
jgi:F-type H+-transporting ATPase subunit gamma